jgi:hypothetical protein
MHRRMVHWIGWFCLTLLLTGVSLPVEAAQPSSGYDFSQITIEEAMADFIAQNHLDGGNYAVSYEFTGTGETYHYAEETYFVGGSIYKLPLCMLYRDKINNGEMTEETTFMGGVPFSDMEYEILVHSNNDYGLYLLRRYPTFREYRLELAAYTEMDPDTLDPLYFSDNNFCTAFFLQILEYLNEHRDVYATELSYVAQAQPGEYLRRYVEDVTVEQKYGWYDGAVNTVGIVETETPYLIAVFTDNLYDAENIIGKTNLIFYDYTDYLMEQQSLALAEEEAAAAAEGAALAEESVQEAISAAATDTGGAENLAEQIVAQAASNAASEALSQPSSQMSDALPHLVAAVLAFLLALISLGLCLIWRRK